MEYGLPLPFFTCAQFNNDQSRVRRGVVAALFGVSTKLLSVVSTGMGYRAT